jgi:rare lipoprotein A (peptidoglycan hydrolase)
MAVARSYAAGCVICGRIIDLSLGGARALGINRAGVVPVSLE